MAWSPISIGDGRSTHHIFTVDGGTPFSLIGLSNSNLSLHLIDMSSVVLYICTGPWTINGDGSAGKADFTPSVADLTAPNGPFARVATYNAYPVVMLSTGPVAMDAQILKIVGLS